MGNRKRLRALVLLLRYSRLRIRDGLTIRREQIKGNRIFLYTQKTGTPVYAPVPPEVIKALEDCPIVHPEYIFWSGNGLPKSAVADAQRSFRRLLKLAGVEGHFHMLMDTLAVSVLEKGVAIETVSVLLGHSDIRVTLKHYRPWVRSLQEKLEFEVQKAWAS